MIVRHCSRATLAAACRADLAASSAALPSFLVPSFTRAAHHSTHPPAPIAQPASASNSLASKGKAKAVDQDQAGEHVGLSLALDARSVRPAGSPSFSTTSRARSAVHKRWLSIPPHSRAQSLQHARFLHTQPPDQPVPTRADEPARASSDLSPADGLYSRRKAKAARLPPLTGPPRNRQELMQYLSVPYPHPLPPNHLLTLRSYVVSLGYLDDAGPVALLGGFAAHARDPRFCVRFLKQALKVMVHAGKEPATIAQALEGPVVKLAKREDWDAVLVLTAAAVRRAGLRTARLTAARVRALYARGRVAEVPLEVGRLEGALSGDLYDDLIGAHLALGNITDAQDTLARKQEAGHPTTVRTALALLEGNWNLNGNLMMEEKLLDQVTKVQLASRAGLRQHVQVLNKILAARTHRADCARALEVMNHFDLSGAPPLALPHADASPASAKAARAQGDLTPSGSATGERWYWRPRPDARTFVTLSSLALREGRRDCAVVLIAQALEAGVEPTSKLLAALIRALAAYGNVKRAEQLYFTLPHRSASLHVPRLGVKLQIRKMTPAPVALEALLAAVLNTRGLEGARVFLERVAKEQGSLPRLTPGLLNTLVAHLSSPAASAAPASIASLLYRLKKLDSAVKRPTVRNLNALLAAQSHRERFAKPTRGSRYRRKLLARAAQGEREALASLQLPRPRAPSPLARLRQSLADAGVPTNLPDTSSRILNLQQARLAPQGMWAFLQSELLDKQLQPTRHHLAIILAAHIRDSDARGALDSLHRGLQLGIERHVALYSVLIGGFARLGKFSLAREVYLEMKQAAVKPDRALYAALALAASRRRDIAAFTAVVNEAERELPLSERLQSPLRTDPVFVALHYRTLVVSRRVLDALTLVRQRLAQGLVPDRVLQLAVRRTNRWLRWKTNQLSRGRGAGRQALLAAVGERDIDRVARHARLLDIKLRRQVRRGEQKDREGELGKIAGLWERGRAKPA